MKLLIVNESPFAQPRKFLEDWIARLEKELRRRRLVKADFFAKELTLVFLDQGPARRLNRQFRRKNYATDVLSFEGLDKQSLGELVLCPEVLRRQARENRHAYKYELGYMVLHGILHLLGYDHETSSVEAEKMFALQDQLFDKLLP